MTATATFKAPYAGMCAHCCREFRMGSVIISVDDYWFHEGCEPVVQPQGIR